MNTSFNSANLNVCGPLSPERVVQLREKQIEGLLEVNRASGLELFEHHREIDDILDSTLDYDESEDHRLRFVSSKTFASKCKGMICELSGISKRSQQMMDLRWRLTDRQNLNRIEDPKGLASIFRHETVDTGI
jgi:hypothetical protein